MDEIVDPLDVTDLLRQATANENEFAPLLICVRKGSIATPRGKPRTISIVQNSSTFARISWNAKGRVKSVLLCRSDLPQLSALIAHVKVPVRKKVLRTVLYTSREISGYVTVPGWIQIRPIEEVIADKTPTSYVQRNPRFYAFGLEVEYQGSRVRLIDSHRSQVAIETARALVAAFLNVPVFSPTSGWAHALVDGQVALVQLTSPAFHFNDDTTFSDVAGLDPCAHIGLDAYYNDVPRPKAKLEFPDLAKLYGAYQSLGPELALRFVRASANIFDAGDPSLKPGTALTSAVTAIECLIENDDQRCKTCDSHLGLTAAFKSFIAEHVDKTGALQATFDKLYPSRSRHVHGARHASVDEVLFTILPEDTATLQMISWIAAKRGIVNWLLATAKV